MSDIMNHGRTDLVELPADCEADYYGKLIQSSPLACSPYLTLPIRSEQQARSDLHARLVASADMLKGNVVELSYERAKRQGWLK